ncbi:hypothetical protein HN51_016161, partial [Arachis hypogaea]
MNYEFRRELNKAGRHTRTSPTLDASHRRASAADAASLYANLQAARRPVNFFLRTADKPADRAFPRSPPCQSSPPLRLQLIRLNTGESCGCCFKITCPLTATSMESNFVDLVCHAPASFTDGNTMYSSDNLLNSCDVEGEKSNK